MTNARWGWVLGSVLLWSCGDAPTGEPGGGTRPPVVVRTDPASNAQCPYGGSVVSSGTDNNRNDVLDDAEVTTRAVVCNPAPVQPPPTILVRLVAEPPGSNCAAGGVAVQSGPDQNSNNTLDDGEVAHVDYVCGQALLTRLASEPAGAHCIAGGVAFLAGRDRDGDHILADAEIEVTEYECGDVLSRDVRIASEADAAALANIRVITGDLSVSFVVLDLVSLPRLEHVSGALRISAFQLTRLSLPQLQDVDGDFTLSGELTAIEFPQLRRVGRLEVMFTGGLHDLSGLPALTEVDRDVRIIETFGLTSIVLSNLSIGGDLEIESNQQLTRVAAQLWDRVGWVNISDNPVLEAVDVSVAPQHAATATIDTVDFFADDKLTHLALGADRVDSLLINFDPLISELDLDVARFVHDVLIFDITTPFRLGLSRPRGDGGIEFGDHLTISSPLETFESTAPVTVDGLLVFDKTRLRTLDARAQIAAARGGVRFSDNAVLTEIAPFTLGAGLQLINNSVLESVPFLPLLKQDELDGVVITGNPVLTAVPSLAAVVRVRGIVELQNNALVGQLFGAALTWVDGPLLVADNNNLRGLRLPNLEHVGELAVGTSPVLETLEMPSLVDSPEELFISQNPRLRHIVFDSLSRAGLFLVNGNPRLPSCEVRAVFAHVTGVRSQSGNDDTATCGP
jgi:hypothetical protein